MKIASSIEESSSTINPPTRNLFNPTVLLRPSTSGDLCPPVVVMFKVLVDNINYGLYRLHIAGCKLSTRHEINLNY